MNSQSDAASIPVPLLRSCIESADVAPLLPYLRDAVPCSHEFPHLHRIVDFPTDESRGYRVCRCCACSERITIIPTDFAAAVPGVPLEVTGVGLQQWVSDEIAHVEEDSPDCYYSHEAQFVWSKYM